MQIFSNHTFQGYFREEALSNVRKYKFVELKNPNQIKRPPPKKTNKQKNTPHKKRKKITDRDSTVKMHQIMDMVRTLSWFHNRL